MARSKTELAILLVLFQVIHHLKGNDVSTEWVSAGSVTYFWTAYPEVITDTYDPLQILGVLSGRSQVPSTQYLFVLEAAGNLSSIAFSKERVMSYRNTTGQGNYTLANRASITRDVLTQLNSSYFRTTSRYCTEYPDACGFLTPPLFYHRMKDLHGFLDDFYRALIVAFETSATKLQQSGVPDGEPQLCKKSMERLWCEVQANREDIQSALYGRSLMIKAAHMKHRVCPLRGTGYPYKVIDIVRVRQVYLALGIAFCGGLREGGRETEMVSVMADFSSAANSWDADEPPSAVWTHPSVTIANEEADRLNLPKGWPSSSAAVSNYTKLAIRIDRRMKEVWKEDLLFSSIVFHPSTEAAYAIIGDIGKPQQEVETKEQFKKNAGNFQSPRVPMYFIQREDANIIVSKRSKNCSEDQKSDWFKRHGGAIIEQFSSRKRASPAEVKDDFKEFAGWNKCFQGAAIIKCAYRFVWYELAWTYYKSFSPCKFCVDVGDGSFGQCLCIALIP